MLMICVAIAVGILKKNGYAPTEESVGDTMSSALLVDGFVFPIVSFMGLLIIMFKV